MDSEEESRTEMYDYSEDDGMCNMKSNHEKLLTIQTCLYSFIFALGLLGNILVLATYAFYRKAKNMTDIFLVNVALADLLFVLALPLIIYNENYSWSMGTWACKLLSGTYSINLYSSMLLLACISGDRYVAIVKARNSFGIRKKAQIYSRLICSIIWLLAISLSIPTLIYYKVIELENLNGETEETVCFFKYNTTETAKVMKILLPSTQVSVGFFVPLLVMGFCYISILLTLLRAQNYQRHKAVRVVLAVVIVFILCHLPYNVLLLVHTKNLFAPRPCKEEQNILFALNVTKIVAYLHCCINPILYAFIGVKFRNHFCKIMEDLWCLGKRYFTSGRYSQQTSELYIPAHKSSFEVDHENPSSFSM
ncbi:C-C chemokine receptor type 6 [Astyanax mexicanus]|uniref:C-C motif chemokine receptor 6 n=2 Tax=Astyanax mexicanus TaxID=7994 RepID=W5LUV9_ASTMX|nr:C-C chemokine receptor type 6 [Astyanax mexicanus]KAG9268819.1 C-C chemokine receptor type 6-like [Astyanax mexicanus]